MITTTTTCDDCGKVEVKKGPGGTLGSSPPTDFIDVWSNGIDGKDGLDLTFCTLICLSAHIGNLEIAKMIEDANENN